MKATKPSKTNRTRHKEYSLIFAVIAIFTLFYFKNADAFTTVLAINLISLVAILSSAFSVVRHADVLAHRLGEPFGSLILSLSVVILEVSLISALMASGDAGPALMRDTLYSVILIVMAGLVGIALLLGGQKFSTQRLNLDGIKQYLIAILPLAVLVLIFPAVVDSLTNVHLVIIAVISAAIYAVFLIIQTKTHQCLFVYENEDESDDKNDHEGKPSAHSSLWHSVWLIVHLIVVISITKINAQPLERLLTELNAPAQFTGFLVALLILSPEALGAIRAVLNNQLQRAMNLFFGSVLATISLTVPAITMIALVTNQTLELGLAPANIVVLSCCLVLCQSSFVTGRTNALNGAAHLTVFALYLMTIMM